MADAFYLPTAEPDRFLATEHTHGPWARELQHAGPPSALVARAVERTPSSTGGAAQLARLTVEILGPVPVAEVLVTAQVTRPGRSVELVEAELTAEGRPVLRARAWRVRTATLDLPAEATGRPAPPPRPDAAATFRQQPFRSGYLKAMEWRFTSGHLEEPGPAVVWCRQLVPLVAGEEPTGVQRTLAAADSGNGVSGLLDLDGWWFINTELTVHLHREPAGEWVCLAARTTLDPSGLGLAETELFDASGRVGRGAQALMVGPRARPAPTDQ